MQTIEEAKEFIARELRESLQHLVGQPYDPEKIKETLLAALRPIYESLGVPTTGPEIRALSELLVISFLGMPEDFDPKALLAGISDSTLALMASRLGGDYFPANLLSIEWMRRQGNIVDWSFKRNSAVDADITFVPKFPVKQITAEFLVDPEEKN